MNNNKEIRNNKEKYFNKEKIKKMSSSESLREVEIDRRPGTRTRRSRPTSRSQEPVYENKLLMKRNKEVK